MRGEMASGLSDGSSNSFYIWLCYVLQVLGGSGRWMAEDTGVPELFEFFRREGQGLRRCSSKLLSGRDQQRGSPGAYVLAEFGDKDS